MIISIIYIRFSSNSLFNIFFLHLCLHQMHTGPYVRYCVEVMASTSVGAGDSVEVIEYAKEGGEQH